MKYTRFMLILAMMAILGSATAGAADFKVIANSGVPAAAISADDLKQVFLATKNSLDGTHVEPVIAKGGAAHEAFLKQCLGKTDAALQTYYRSLVFTGKASMPKALASDAEVASYVSKTKGAIGYVSAGHNAAGVKTLDMK